MDYLEKLKAARNRIEEAGQDVSLLDTIIANSPDSDAALQALRDIAALHEQRVADVDPSRPYPSPAGDVLVTVATALASEADGRDTNRMLDDSPAFAAMSLDRRSRSDTLAERIVDDFFNKPRKQAS